MRQKNPTLQQLLEIWQGEECWLQVQGSRIYLEWDNQYQNNSFDHLLSKGIGVFSNIINSHSRKDRKKSLNSNHWNPKQNMRSQNKMVRERSKDSIENDYVINPRSKSPLRLNQLAEKYEKKLDSQFGTQKRMEPDQYSTQKRPTNKYDFKFPKNNYASEVPSHFDPYQIKVPQQKNIFSEQEQESKYESIMESIKQIKLPDISKSKCSKEYRQANFRFEQMKKQILDKIVNDDIQFQMTEILMEIQEAADQIIMKHKIGDAPQLKRNGTFSFNDLMIDPNFSAKKISHKDKESEENLIKIDELSEDNSNLIKLAPFKDEAGSISSIASDFGVRKQDQDSGKIENIFIVNAENQPFGKQHQNQSASLKECKIQQHLSSKLKLQSNIKGEGSVIKQSLKPQPTQPTIGEQVKSPENKNTSVEVLPLTSNFGEENSVMGSRRKTSTTTYLAYNPSSPIKIANNLDEAKEIDSEVVKFTEYKVKFLEPKSHHQSKVITFTSPLKFRRKEEVVKHLVANKIVEKQSDSIEYPL